MVPPTAAPANGYRRSQADETEEAAVSDPLNDTPTPDEVEQQEAVVPEDDAEPAVGVLDDEHAHADEGDLLEQHRSVPADDESDYYDEETE
jgi:hypothetical protein